MNEPFPPAPPASESGTLISGLPVTGTVGGPGDPADVFLIDVPGPGAIRLRLRDLAAPVILRIEDDLGTVIAEASGGPGTTLRLAAVVQPGTWLVRLLGGEDATPWTLIPLVVPLVEGTTGDDVMLGRPRADLLEGGDGNDILRGGSGPDILFGGAGDDTLSGGAGNDSLDGGAGRNLLSGNEGADTLVASSGASRLLGGSGDDTLILRTFARAYGEEGNDSFVVSNGQQMLLYGGDGDDTMSIGEQVGSPRLYGGNGDDVLILQQSVFEPRIWGGDGDDLIQNPFPRRGWLLGEGGNDTIRAGGMEHVYGGDGNDSLTGGVRVEGGAGDDTIVMIRHPFMRKESIYALGEDGNDTLDGTSWQVEVETRNHTLLLVGGDGDDLILGSFAAPDGAWGGAHNDSINAGSGADTLRLNGGTGSVGMGSNDLAIDRLEVLGIAPGTTVNVHQFEVGIDLIDLRGLDADTGAEGHQALVLAAEATPHAAWIDSGGTDTTVLADLDGDAIADLRLLLQRVAALPEGDLLL